MRERLLAPDFLDWMRAAAPPGAMVRSAAQLAASLDAVLARHDAGSDLYVFGYGSLMWNPAIEHAGKEAARIHGWRRSFCLRSLFGRGNPGEPGLMLALDRGGSCNGVLFRIPASKVRTELELLWRREMALGSYDARWVKARVELHSGSAPVDAVTFVANRRHERYVYGMSIERMAALIRTGKGSLGTCRDYFDSTLRKLRELGIEDRGMNAIAAALRT
jgi:cation transport protein ChaC